MTEPPHRHHAIDYIEIPVIDVAAAKAFYGSAFGWTFTDYGPDYAGIQDPARSAEAGGLGKDRRGTLRRSRRLALLRGSERQRRCGRRGWRTHCEWALRIPRRSAV
jgi:catechol 2,3-dioxygenase-like lactoylglutathione lyase family enzyme